METLLTPLIGLALRHGLTIIAGVLVTLGMLEPAQEANFTTIFTGIVLGGIGLIWSGVKNLKQAKK
jgi:hypothetical protein